MTQLATSFPDSTYTSSNKPSCDTLKADITAIETAHNATDTVASAALQKSGSVTATGNLPMGTKRVTEVGDPTAAQDAATKKYIDDLLSGENSFKVRATPADEDLDADGGQAAWTDWDLTSVVGSTATAVLLRVRAKDDTVGSYIGFRENGDSGATLGLEMSALRVPVVGQSFSQDFTVKCDASQIIEYTTSDAGGAAIQEARATVIGWYQPIS